MQNTIGDFLKCNESIKGVYTLKDKDGNIIFSKKNTITKHGREFIFNTFLRNLFGTSSDKFSDMVDNINTTDLKLKYIVFANDTQMTIPTMTYQNLDFGKNINLDKENNANGKNHYKLELTQSQFTVNTTNDLSLSVTVKFSPTMYGDASTINTFRFNSICLLLSNSSNTSGSTGDEAAESSDANTKYVLFSRVNIDDVFLTSDTSYTLTYSLYF